MSETKETTQPDIAAIRDRLRRATGGYPENATVCADELCEIAYVNDECGPKDESPVARWARVRHWVADNLHRYELAEAGRAALGKREGGGE